MIEHPDTIWHSLSFEDRAAWMAENPTAASASMRGKDPKVSVSGSGLMPRRTAKLVWPNGLTEPDRLALTFWLSLSPAEKDRSPAGAPLGPLQRLARKLGHPASDLTQGAARNALVSALEASR